MTAYNDMSYAEFASILPDVFTLDPRWLVTLPHWGYRVSSDGALITRYVIADGDATDSLAARECEGPYYTSDRQAATAASISRRARHGLLQATVAHRRFNGGDWPLMGQIPDPPEMPFRGLRVGFGRAFYQANSSMDEPARINVSVADVQTLETAEGDALSSVVYSLRREDGVEIGQLNSHSSAFDDAGALWILRSGQATPFWPERGGYIYDTAASARNAARMASSRTA